MEEKMVPSSTDEQLIQKIRQIRRFLPLLLQIEDENFYIDRDLIKKNKNGTLAQNILTLAKPLQNLFTVDNNSATIQKLTHSPKPWRGKSILKSAKPSKQSSTASKTVSFKDDTQIFLFDTNKAYSKINDKMLREFLYVLTKDKPTPTGNIKNAACAHSESDTDTDIIENEETQMLPQTLKDFFQQYAALKSFFTSHVDTLLSLQQQWKNYRQAKKEKYDHEKENNPKKRKKPDTNSDHSKYESPSQKRRTGV